MNNAFIYSHAFFVKMGSGDPTTEPDSSSNCILYSKNRHTNPPRSAQSFGFLDLT